MNRLCQNAVMLLIFLVLGCKAKRETGFYNYSKRGDLFRVPLIKPYEIISADGTEWTYEVDSKNQLPISSIVEIGVKSNFFVIHSSNYYFNSHSGETWLIMDTRTGSKYFETSDGSYDIQVRSLGIESIKLNSPSFLFQYLTNNGKMPGEWPDN